MPPGDAERRGAAADALARTAPLVMRWIERVLAAHDPPVTPTQYLALEAIADGDVVGVELARRAGVSQAAVSQLLASLEEGGLVARDRLADDRRRHALRLTDRGASVVRSARLDLGKRISGLLAGLPAPEVDALARSLDRLAVLLGSTPPPPRPRRPPPPRPRGPRRAPPASRP